MIWQIVFVLRKQGLNMAKYKVKYEIRDYYTRIVEADNPQHAEEIVCQDNVYDIISNELVETEEDE